VHVVSRKIFFLSRCVILGGHRRFG